jgi:Flp pilus assembly protein TadG
MKIRSTSAKSQRGVYLIFFALLLFPLLGGLALTFDGALLYIARLHLIRAVDNSILMAPMLMIGTQDLTRDDVRDGLEKKLRAQISRKYNLSDLTASVVVPDLGEATVSAELNRRFVFAPAVFKVGSSLVSFTSNVIVPRVNASVVIDCSWSMSRIDTLSPCQLKIGTALAAGGHVVAFLRENFDRIALSFFAENGQNMVRFNETSTGGYDKSLLGATGTSLLNNCDGWSNIGDGVRIAASQIDELRVAIGPELSEELNLVLIFTDGLTNHAKMRLANTTATSGVDPDSDYHVFITNFKENLSVPDLYQASGYALRQIPLAGDSQTGYLPSKPSCESDEGYPASTPPDHSSCFTSGFAFLAPTGNVIAAPSDISGPIAHEMMFLHALTMSDQIRAESRAHIYALTISDPGSKESSRFDETTLNLGIGKMETIDAFMRRLTIPPESASDPSFRYIPTATAEYNQNKDFSGDAFRVKTQIDATRGTRSALADIWYRKQY